MALLSGNDPDGISLLQTGRASTARNLKLSVISKYREDSSMLTGIVVTPSFEYISGNEMLSVDDRRHMMDLRRIDVKDKKSGRLIVECGEMLMRSSV